MIGIRADGNDVIGLGHLMRCISIAEELISRNQEVVFILANDSDESLLKSKGFSFHKLSCFGEQGWDSNEVVKWVKQNHCDTLLLDTYRIDVQDFDILSQIPNVIYLDDMYAFDYRCDCLINYNMEAIDKYPISSYERKMYLGADYFPLRKEFCQESNRAIAMNVERVLITTGSTDVYEIALRIMQHLVPKYITIDFFLLEGKYYQDAYKEKISAFASGYKNAKILSWGQNMAKIYNQMDLVISPGSTSIYEALSMNVPCISYEFADNQHEQCYIMDKLHMVPCLGNLREMDVKEYKCLVEVFEKQLEYERRREQSQLFSPRLDKGGTKRIVDVIMGMSECIQ